MGATDWLANQLSGAASQYGIPASDPGAAIARNKQPTHIVDTSNIFNGGTMEQATTWRVHRGPGEKPISAMAGKGNFFGDTSSVSQTAPQ